MMARGLQTNAGRSLSGIARTVEGAVSMERRRTPAALPD
jgi:hypothetical protein